MRRRWRRAGRDWRNAFGGWATKRLGAGAVSAAESAFYSARSIERQHYLASGIRERVRIATASLTLTDSGGRPFVESALAAKLWSAHARACAGRSYRNIFRENNFLPSGPGNRGWVTGKYGSLDFATHSRSRRFHNALHRHTSQDRVA